MSFVKKEQLMVNGERIFINGRFLTKPVSGVQRYARELLGALDRQIPASIQIICLVPPVPFTTPAWQHIEVRRVGTSQGNLWEQLDLPLHARGALLFSPANIGPFAYSNQIVTMHDASIFAVPQAYSRAFRLKYAFVFRQLAQRAKRILTVSDFSRRELARYLHADPQRFTVIHNGADHLDRIAGDVSVLEKHGLQKDGYWLTVASQGAHKNLQSAFALTGNMPLVVVGGHSRGVFATQGQRKLPAHVRMIGFVNDRELKSLYENALALIFPSCYEGFGLPVLEAMRCACPVLCANTAALPEIAGDAALYLDSPGAFDRFLASPTLRDDLRRKGLAHSARFTWAEAARETLRIMTGA